MVEDSDCVTDTDATRILSKEWQEQLGIVKPEKWIDFIIKIHFEKYRDI